MAAVTSNPNQARARRVAVKRVEGFAKQFGEAHRNLARHAAFPLSLTPDLLYQIWANFVPEAPWEAVAHLLLSRLCRQVGYEMYEMDISDRNLLLRELKEQFGQERLDELAEFLLDYVAQRLTDDDPDTQSLAEAQEWTALAYTKPNELARELAEALSARVKQEDMTEVFRLTSLVETFAEPLLQAGFEPLLIYSRQMSTFVRGNHKDVEVQLALLKRKPHYVQIAGVKLPTLRLNTQDIVSEQNKDEQLRQLITEVLKYPTQSLVRRQAMNQLLRTIQKLPGLMKSSHLEYESALQQTWLSFIQNIDKFNLNKPSLHKELILWINNNIRHEILKYNLDEYRKKRMSVAVDNVDVADFLIDFNDGLEEVERINKQDISQKLNLFMSHSFRNMPEGLQKIYQLSKVIQILQINDIDTPAIFKLSRREYSIKLKECKRLLLFNLNKWSRTNLNINLDYKDTNQVNTLVNYIDDWVISYCQSCLYQTLQDFLLHKLSHEAQFLLSYYNHNCDTQILAQSLNMSESVVNQKITIVKQKLKERLQEWVQENFDISLDLSITVEENIVTFVETWLQDISNWNKDIWC
ncbi:MAG: hypothetical protein RID53_19975 [Coleofasciculus sp. B1-GNL1-01]|uniref:hypothetical protein n=1 Tax=Coleofasciculus sp. B1-GNL1-01 TaxID=3068484 RepID=UPI0032F3D657